MLDKIAYLHDAYLAYAGTVCKSFVFRWIYIGIYLVGKLVRTYGVLLYGVFYHTDTNDTHQFVDNF